jgi:hypothetical protein
VCIDVDRFLLGCCIAARTSCEKLLPTAAIIMSVVHKEEFSEKEAPVSSEDVDLDHVPARKPGCTARNVLCYRWCDILNCLRRLRNTHVRAYPAAQLERAAAFFGSAAHPNVRGSV